MQLGFIGMSSIGYFTLRYITQVTLISKSVIYDTILLLCDNHYHRVKYFML